MIGRRTSQTTTIPINWRLKQSGQSGSAQPKQEVFRVPFPWHFSVGAYYCNDTHPIPISLFLSSRNVHFLGTRPFETFRISNAAQRHRCSLSNTLSAAMALSTRLCPKLWAAVVPTTPRGTRLLAVRLGSSSINLGRAISPTLQPRRRRPNHTCDPALSRHVGLKQYRMRG